MKKTLVALAVAGALVGSAQAQSSVTLFGVIDLNVQRVHGSGNGSINRLGNNGLTTPRWGIRGTEDLGGGMSGGFWLEGGFNPDDGTQATASTDNRSAAASSLFGRRSTVSLITRAGELRLGRDLTPDYQGVASGDVFGASGSAQSLAAGCSGLTGVTCVSNVRVSNSIAYHLPPNLGGLYGSVMYALGEAVTNANINQDGNHFGTRVGLAIAPVDINAYYGKTKYSVAGVSLLAGDFERYGLVASVKFGTVRPVAFYNKSEVGATERTDWGLGVETTFGSNVLRAQYNDYNVKNTANDASLIGIGYAYNLSRRTALYANYGRVDNDGSGVSFSTSGGRAATVGGGTSQGYEVGLRHSF